MCCSYHGVLCAGFQLVTTPKRTIVTVATKTPTLAPGPDLRPTMQEVQGSLVAQPIPSLRMDRGLSPGVNLFRLGEKTDERKKRKMGETPPKDPRTKLH